MAAEILRFRADEEPGFELDWLGIEPHPWIETTEGRRFPAREPYNPPYFSMWARAVLLAWLLDRDPLALEFRRRLDEWCDGGNPPVDLLRYPEPREYLLLEPIRSGNGANATDIEMLRHPHQVLHRSMDWDPFDDEPDDGLWWTKVDSPGRRVISSEYD